MHSAVSVGPAAAAAAAAAAEEEEVKIDCRFVFRFVRSLVSGFAYALTFAFVWVVVSAGSFLAELQL